jgi:hypothetical protein
MKIKAIKKGNILELKCDLNILDGSEIIISIADDDLLDRTYEVVHQKVIAEMKVDSLGSLETEEDIINLAIKLTS